MNVLIEKGHIEQMNCAENFAYILNDNKDFLTTQYKVLQSQSSDCFVKCMKMMYNGRIQLYYLTSGLRSLASMLPTMDPDRFITVITNLLSDILDVKHNGFLFCHNIDATFERIYVNPTTLKVQLVYLPLSRRLYEDSTDFENELRTGVVRLISDISTIRSPRTEKLAADMSNGMLSLEELFGRVKTGQTEFAAQEKKKPAAEKAKPVLRIRSVNAATQVEFVVDKDDFVLGKRSDACDGVIDFNKMVSRTHCVIRSQNGGYGVRDLQSVNGTYVNNVRVLPEQIVSLQDGDFLKLANSEFLIVIQ